MRLKVLFFLLKIPVGVSIEEQPLLDDFCSASQPDYTLDTENVIFSAIFRVGHRILICQHKSSLKHKRLLKNILFFVSLPDCSFYLVIRANSCSFTSTSACSVLPGKAVLSAPGKPDALDPRFLQAKTSFEVIGNRMQRKVHPVTKESTIPGSPVAGILHPCKPRD